MVKVSDTNATLLPVVYIIYIQYIIQLKSCIKSLIINKCSAIVTCIEHSLFLKREIILRYLYIYIYIHIFIDNKCQRSAR